ncbi:titin-like [Anaeramoeba ignava]|uniref:Titin-like n=1 Tax=Anaeramoeba ignava TaxID=1746090 RepID=A0A9Q0R6C2_ANAIG|nr:titin-like [Anaeramoeba ignava]
MKQILLSFLIFVFLAIFVFSIPCDFYVDVNGEDNGECTESRPCQKIKFVLDLLQSSGKTICINEGTYQIERTLQHPEFAFNLIGLDGPDVTEINGGNAFRCLFYNLRLDQPEVIIHGITFRHCFSIQGDGGAIKIECEQPLQTNIISNCYFYENNAQKSGGAIYADNCHLSLQNLRIEGNQADNTGGGFACYSATDHPDIEFNNVTIVDNAGGEPLNIDDISLTRGSFISPKAPLSSCTYNTGLPLKDCNLCFNGGNCQPNGECVCQPGSGQPSPQCEFCQLGYYSDLGQDCMECENDKYAPQKGTIQCLDCPGLTKTYGTGQYECTPQQVTNVHLITATSTSLEIGWTNPTLFSIDGYTIYYKLEGGSEQSTQIVGEITQTEITNLESGNYTIRIIAYNPRGDGEETPPYLFQTLNISSPSEVTNLQESTQEKTSTSWKIVWSHPLNDGGSPITTYEIGYCEIGKDDWVYHNVSTSVTSYVANGLLSGEYNVTVRAANNYHFGNISNITIWTLPAISPSIMDPVSLHSKTSVSLELTWIPPTSNGGKSIYGYEIVGYGPQSIQIEVENITTYNITGLLSGEYSIKIRALNGIPGNFSNSVNFSTNDPKPPSKIENIQFISNTQSSINFNWTIPENGGSSLIGYRLSYRISGSNDSWTYVTISPPINIYEIDSLLNGSYDIIIQAKNEKGLGIESDIVTFNTASPTEPSQIITANKIEGETTSISLRWEEPFNGGLLIDNYQIDYKVSTDPEFNESAFTNSTNTSITIEGLQSGKNYSFIIRASNQIGWGNFSIIFTFSTGNSSTPSTVQNLQSISSTSTSITLQWEEPSNTGGEEIIKYTIYYKRLDYPGWLYNNYFVEPSQSIFNYTITGLLSSNYTINVTASNLNGEGDISSINTQTQLPTTPDQPRNISLISSTKGSVYITWQQPLSNGGAQITNYSISWESIDEGTTTGNIMIPSTPLSRNLSVNYSGNYTIYISAINIAGNGTNQTSSVETLSATVPEQINELTHNGSTTTSFSIGWKRPYHGGKEILYFDINCTDGESIFEYTLQTSNQSIIYEVTNLFYATYSCQVSSNNSIGRSLISNTCDFYTLYPSAPSSVRNISLINRTSSSLFLNWIEPLSTGGKPIYTYEITHNHSFNAIETNSTETYFNLTELESGNYSIQIWAKNSRGASPDCDPFNTETLEAQIPFSVDTFRADDVNRYSIKYKWNQPPSSGKPILSYIFTVNQTIDSTIVTNQTLSNTTFEYLVNGLNHSSNYTAQIFAINVLGAGTSITIINETRGFIPEQISEVNSTSYYYQVLFEWIYDDPDLTGYTINITSNDNTTNKTIKVLNPTASSSIITNLIPATDYEIIIRAEIYQNYSEWSLPYSVRTLDYHPEKIQNISMIRKTDTSLTLEWNEPRNNGQPITKYNLDISDETGIIEFIIEAATNSVVIGDLNSTTTYLIQISAVNDIGEGEWSDIMNFTTDSKQETSSSNSKAPVYIGVGVSAGVVVVGLGLFIFFYRRKKAVKVTASVNVYSVNDDDDDLGRDLDDPQNDIPKKGDEDDVSGIVMQTIKAEEDLYLQSVKNESSVFSTTKLN